ncbi:MAG: ArsA-related P-loop ATPase [Polyangiaceae bacterium]
MRPRAENVPTYLDQLVREKRVIVCCGAGGVGKTTTSAAIGLAGAAAGRRVLVLTIDPARRLAEAMGIPESGKSPALVPRERLDAAGLADHGELHAWMLQPAVVFEDIVNRMSESRAHAEKILANRLYRALSSLIAGMQEYTAAEALYTLSSSGKYDLVVLDTPPSRNALEFLEGPGKLSQFLDEKVIGLFLPKKSSGLFWKRATELVGTVFGRVFGEGFFGDIQEFLGLFSGMFASMREHATAVRELLQSDDASFVLVTSPEPTALAEVAFFRQRILDMGLPFAGYVLNRSWAYTRGFESPESFDVPADAPDLVRSAHEKLVAFANEERERAAHDRDLLAKLREASETVSAVASPHLGEGIEDLAGLVNLARSLTATGSARG